MGVGLMPRALFGEDAELGLKLRQRVGKSMGAGRQMVGMSRAEEAHRKKPKPRIAAWQKRGGRRHFVVGVPRAMLCASVSNGGNLSGRYESVCARVEEGTGQAGRGCAHGRGCACEPRAC